MPDLCQPGKPVRIREGDLRAGDLESVAHGAKRAGVSAAYLYRLIRVGKLRAYDVSGILLLHRDDVDAFIQSRKAS